MEQRTYTRGEVIKGGAAALLGASLASSLATRKASALTRSVAVGTFVTGSGALHGDFTELNNYINLVNGVDPSKNVGPPKLVSVFSPWVPEGGTNYLYPHTDNLTLFYDTYPDSLLIWSWEPFGLGTTPLQDISSGVHDAYIDDVAQRVRVAGIKDGDVAGKRVLIRFAHEMNGHWFWPWLRKDESGEPIDQHAASYIAAWQHVVDRFRLMGATNAEWVWSPNIISSQADDFSPWYPGDGYVDWTGLDGYNWGTVQNNPWQTFRQIFGYSIGVMAKLSPRGIIICETGCHSTGLNGEDKGLWYDDMAATLKQNYPQVQGLVNTHTISRRDPNNPYDDAEWRVDMPITALDNWHAHVADAQFNKPLVAARTAFGDTTAPKVTALTPSNGASGVSPSANVTATFSEAMKASTINSTTFKLFRLNADGTTSRVAATVSYQRKPKKAVLNPNNNLRSGATYKAVIGTGARDLANNALDQNQTKAGSQGKTWKFTVRRT